MILGQQWAELVFNSLLCFLTRSRASACYPRKYGISSKMSFPTLAKFRSRHLMACPLVPMVINIRTRRWIVQDRKAHYLYYKHVDKTVAQSPCPGRQGCLLFHSPQFSVSHFSRTGFSNHFSIFWRPNTGVCQRMSTMEMPSTGKKWSSAHGLIQVWASLALCGSSGGPELIKSSRMNRKRLITSFGSARSNQFTVGSSLFKHLPMDAKFIL